MRSRRAWRARLGGPAVAALALGGALVAVAGSPVAGATTFGPVDSTIADGSANSLRDILENQVGADDVVLLQNGATYVLDFDCAGAGGDILVPFDVTIQAQNIGTGVANATIQQTCPGERVLDMDGDNLVLTNVTITGGRTDGDGGGIGNVDEITLAQAAIVGNNAGDDGGGFDADNTVTVTNSTIAGNCSDDEGGAFRANSEQITITNSTITGNTTGRNGAIAAVDSDTTLVYVTLGGNTFDNTDSCAGVSAVAASTEEPADPQDAEEVAPQQVDPANIGNQGGSLTSFGSAIVQPTGGPNCDIEAGTTTSNGYNFSDDDTCGFTNTGTGDRETAGDPGLGALASNGGPTQTRLPASTSPLLNFIPLAACQSDGAAGVTTDQRGVIRPQETGCEIGAVEVPSVPLVAAFTG